MFSIELYSLPSDVKPASLKGKLAVAVDVLRAGTTIATALESGATGILPCLDVPTARSRDTQSTHSLLGGERQGVRIEGFDLSNSPADYRSDVVAGHSIVFTTTNGTMAIETCRSAEEILIGSFVNLGAVCHRLAKGNLPIAIVCAGTNGQPTLEDSLFGGAICHLLGKSSEVRLNPAARAASEMWKTTLRQIKSGKSLAEILCQTQGGKNLVRLDLIEDIEFAAEIDRFDFVPIFNSNNGMIRADVDLAGRHR